MKTGERIVCMCWWPKPCHGNLIIDEIKRRTRIRAINQIGREGGPFAENAQDGANRTE